MVVLFVGINRTVLCEMKLLQELRHPNIIGVGTSHVIERLLRGGTHHGHCQKCKIHSINKTKMMENNLH